MKDKNEQDQTPVKADGLDSKQAFTWQDCKNCGYHFEGQFCPACGQSIKEYRQTLGQFLGDFLGSVFALDVRLYKTLPTLLFKPGELSGDYIEGRRQKHVAPFRLYFFVSIVFFFLLSWQTSRVIDRDVTLSELNQAQGNLLRITSDEHLPSKKDSSQVAAVAGERIRVTDQIRKELERQLEVEDLTPDERANREKWIAYLGSPSVVINKAIQYLSWTLFLLMPWLAFILYIFFRKRRRFYIEHLIYSVNIHTFIFVVLIVLSLIGLVFPGLLDKILGYVLILILVYSVIGVRKFYRQKWGQAVMKTFAVMVIYLITSVLLLSGSVILIIKII